MFDELTSQLRLQQFPVSMKAELTAKLMNKLLLFSD